MATIRIKVCGITSEQDALVAARLGADAVGFIFFEKSPRFIYPEDAAEIIKKLPPFISRVGVFVNTDIETIIYIAQRIALDTIQLHGSETPAFCKKIPYPVIKAFALGPDFDPTIIKKYSVAGILLDAWKDGISGGTGITCDWKIAKKIADLYGNVILAGGLGPSNIEEAITSVRPYGVDLNSGVEIKPGIKNPHKLRETIHIIKRLTNNL